MGPVSTDGGLRQLFPQHLCDAHWQSIETGALGTGTPDAEYCFPGGLQGWVEYKVASAIAVKIRPGQIGWAERRARMGGRVTLAVRQKVPRGPRRTPVDALFLYRGADIRAVHLNGLATPPLAVWGGGPARWDWTRVRAILTR